jgi:hypothetical protein
MTPTPSVTLCRILPSAKDFSVVFGTSSIGAAFGDGDPVNINEALLRFRCNGVGSLSRGGWGGAAMAASSTA